MSEPKPTLWTRFLRWLASFLDRKADQQDADAAAVTHLQDAAHAAHDAQVAAPNSRARFVDGVRDGASL